MWGLPVSRCEFPQNSLRIPSARRLHGTGDRRIRSRNQCDIDNARDAASAKRAGFSLTAGNLACRRRRDPPSSAAVGLGCGQARPPPGNDHSLRDRRIPDAAHPVPSRGEETRSQISKTTSEIDVQVERAHPRYPFIVIL